MIDARFPSGKPVVILSDNSIEAALLGLAAMHVGRPYCMVSSAYCRLTKSYAKISGILDMLSPALVYASDARVYGPAVAAWGSKAPVFFGANANEHPGARSFAALEAASETEAVMDAFAAIRPSHHAKYLLTSGSTGFPKVVINTHRMLCANQQQISQVWPFLLSHPLVLVDWLPWSHTFGANHNFNMVLSHGGSMYIDEGRPAPGLIENSLRNLRDVKPNFYFNVPRGFDMLLPYLEQDDRDRAGCVRAHGRHLLRRRGPAAEPVAASGSRGQQGARAAGLVHLRLGLHGDLARHDSGALAHREGRLPRPAAARRRAQVHAQWRTSSRCACAGPTSFPAIWTRMR